VSQVTDVAGKEIEDPVADEVITKEPELEVSFFVECFSLLTNIQNLWLL
jgi:hypothetical protein